MAIKEGKCTLTNVQVDTAGTTHTAYVFEMVPVTYILNVFARVKTAFAGVTAPTVSLGISGDTDLLIQSQPINRVGDLKPGFSRDGEGFCAALPGYPQKAEARRTIIATFSSSSGNFSSLTAGEIEFKIVYVE